MDFSVVIPVYNRPEMLERAVRSVENQTCPPVELIIVNDGSTDTTGEVIDSFTTSSRLQIQSIEFTENQGVSAARNAGIKAASSEWIALLDSDDEWFSEKLERQIQYHQKHPDLKISQCNEIWIRNGHQVNKRTIHRKKSGRFFRESLKLCLVSPSAVILHQSIFNETGYFDETMPACEDYDFWLRVLIRYPAGLLDEPLLCRYGGHEDQLSAKYWGMDHWRVQAMEKHLDAELSPEWKIALYQELIAKLQVLHQGAVKRKKSEAREYARKLAEYRSKLSQLRE